MRSSRDFFFFCRANSAHVVFVCMCYAQLHLSIFTVIFHAEFNLRLLNLKHLNEAITCAFAPWNNGAEKRNKNNITHFFASLNVSTAAIALLSVVVVYVVAVHLYLCYIQFYINFFSESTKPVPFYHFCSFHFCNSA